MHTSFNAPFSRDMLVHTAALLFDNVLHVFQLVTVQVDYHFIRTEVPISCFILKLSIVEHSLLKMGCYVAH